MCIRDSDKTGELNWDAYNKAFEMGLICADLPAEYGGQGLSAVSGAWIREELIYGDAGFGLTCGTNNLGIKPVLLFGTEAVSYTHLERRKRNYEQQST